MKLIVILATMLLAFAVAACGSMYPISQPYQQFFDQNGIPLSGGKVYSCQPGTTCTSTSMPSPKSTYTDSTGGNANTNPIVLDSAGRAGIWGSGFYKLAIYDSFGNLIKNVDNVPITYNYVTPVTLPWVDASNYASLNAAVTAIGSNPATLTIKTANYSMTGPVTVPATLAINIVYPGSINQGSYTLTINSPFSASGQAFTGSGAVTGLQESRPELFGAKGDGSTDDTSAINSAIRSTDGWVHFSAGKTYIVNPATAMTFAGGNTLVAFPMKSNMYLDLTGATLKLKASYSTDGAPKRGEFFGAITALSNIVIKGGTLDGNGANNTISPSRPTSYNRYTQSFVIFSTDTGSGSNVLLDGVTFQNAAGTSVLRFAESNTVGTTLGQGWTVRNCNFVNNGTDTDDVSNIYAFAENVLIDGNTFSRAAMPTVGSPTAIEIHGAHTRVVNNHIINFYQGMWQSVNYTSDTHDVLIANNQMTVQHCGIDFEHDLTGEKDLYGISIKNNIITMDDSDNRAAGLFKIGIGNGALNAIHDISVTGNLIKKLGSTYWSTAFSLGKPATGQKHTGFVYDNNQIVHTLYGLYANMNLGGSYGLVTYNNNRHIDLTPATGHAYPYGVIVSTIVTTPFDYLELKGNSILDNISPVNALPATGISVSGYMNALDVEGNTYKNLAGNYTESMTISPRYRYGSEARSVFVAAPVAGIWNIGDRIPNNTPAVGHPKAWSQTTNANGVGAYSVTRGNTTGYSLGVWALWTTGTTVWEVTTAGGNTAGSPPYIVGENPGDTVVDGSITWTMRTTDKAVWTSEGNL